MALLSFLLRDVAIGALLVSLRPGVRRWSPRGGRRDRVRHVGAEGDAAHALGRDRLLLDVDRLAVVVVRADVDGARRAGRADAVAGDVAVAGQHVDVVAQRLEVVGDVIARDVALVVQRRHLHVGLLRQVAAEAARVPRRMAGDAAHVLVGSGRRRSRRRPGRSPQTIWPSGVEAHGLGQVGLLVVVLAARVDGVGDLHDLPAEVLLDHRVLNDLVAAALEAALAERGAQRLAGSRPPAAEV